jgi:hypothetical protein
LFPPPSRVFDPKAKSRYWKSFKSFKRVAWAFARYREPETNIIVLKKNKFWFVDDDREFCFVVERN